MRNILASLIVAVLVVGSVQIVSAAMTDNGTANSVMYVCSCGPDCSCDTISDNPGKCKCGKEMTGMHLLKREGNKGIFCQCGPDCTCKIDPNDPSKCGCGKDVKTADITGMYVCACGDDCDCNSISEKPGKCRCGNEMKQLK